MRESKLETPKRFQYEKGSSNNIQLFDFKNSSTIKMIKFYNVWLGWRLGIYNSWTNCKMQVDGVTRAEHNNLKFYKKTEDFLNFKS
jgi:viroplasmin and RNaseH domain-containing protein